MSDATKKILREIDEERARQIAKGWTPEHDDDHEDGMIAVHAAAAIDPYNTTPWLTPWTRRADLIRGIALAVAEVERLDRLSAKEPTHD